MNPENSKLARSLFSKTAKLEQDLASTLQKKSPAHHIVTQLRNQIRDTYEQIFFLDLEFAFQKDVYQLLWKCVFYKRIEEFRKMIARNPQPTPHGQELQKEKLHKIHATFQEFLADASKYYESFYAKLEAKYSKDQANKQNESIYLSILQRTIIVLGDLARYAQFHSESQSKDWSNAVSYYKKAHTLIPSNGNPHNQLAVIAMYQNNYFEGCYRYFRSLAVKKPFMSARENLILLFEHNRKRYKVLLSQANTVLPSHQPRKRKLFYKEVAKSNEELMEILLTEFVCLHGILFTKINVETFDEIMQSTLKIFGQILSSDAYSISPEIMFQMMVMNIFSLDRNSSNPDEDIAKHSLNLSIEMFAIMCRFCKEPEFKYLSAIHILSSYMISKRQVFAANNLESFWAVFTQFANRVAVFDERADIKQVLPEDNELRGFKPLEVPTTVALDTEAINSEQLTMIRISRFANLVAESISDYSSTVQLDQQTAKYMFKPSREDSVSFLITQPQQNEDEDEGNDTKEEEEQNAHEEQAEETEELRNDEDAEEEVFVSPGEGNGGMASWDQAPATSVNVHTSLFSNSMFVPYSMHQVAAPLPLTATNHPFTIPSNVASYNNPWSSSAFLPAALPNADPRYTNKVIGRPQLQNVAPNNGVSVNLFGWDQRTTSSSHQQQQQQPVYGPTSQQAAYGAPFMQTPANFSSNMNGGSVVRQSAMQVGAQTVENAPNNPQFNNLGSFIS